MRYIFVFVVALMILPLEVYSQKVKKVKPPKDPEWTLFVDSEGRLRRQPTFELQHPKDSFTKWAAKNFKYPEVYPKPFYGTTVVQFYVQTDGKIVQVDILKSSGNFYLDMAAVKTVAQSPNWEPALVDGEPAEVKFTFPITFRIPAPNQNTKKSNSGFRR